MQTLGEIRQMLEDAGLQPRKQFGQNFLIDQNLMRKLLDLADLDGDETVLEVGPGTGSLTEELLQRCRQVVAVEIDRSLAALVEQRLGGADNLRVLAGDVLAGKHALNGQVPAALPGEVHLVANLPYSIAVPLLAQCLICSWRARCGSDPAGAPCFPRMTFTVQQELADKLAAAPGGKTYGPVSVLVGLLGAVRMGPKAPAEAFWPRPKVASRMVRIDFEEAAAKQLADVDVLTAVTAAAFGHRRKQLGFLLHDPHSTFDPGALERALTCANIETAWRVERVRADQFRTVANVLAEQAGWKRTT